MFPGQDHAGGGLQESGEAFAMTLMAGDDTAVVLQPCEQAPDLPPAPISA